MTQHEKIIEMCVKKDWNCQIEFWNLFIRSPHKRRGEIEEKGIYHFIDRKCEHGVKNGKDYMMIKLPTIKLPPAFKKVETKPLTLFT